MDFGKVLALIDAMNREGVEYTIIGSVAMAVHGLVRATTDADFLIRAEISNVERLKRALRSIWNDPLIDEIRPEELIGDFPALFYGPPGESFGLDVISRIDGDVYESVPAEVVELAGYRMPVATQRALYDMKSKTDRYLDRWDCRNFDDHFADEEEDARLEIQNA